MTFLASNRSSVSRSSSASDLTTLSMQPVLGKSLGLQARKMAQRENTQMPSHRSSTTAVTAMSTKENQPEVDKWRTTNPARRSNTFDTLTMSPTPIQFKGFSQKQMDNIREMTALLRRNEYLSILEAVVAGMILANSGSDNYFEMTERLLYTCCCLSNAYCLRVARTHFQSIQPNDKNGLVLALAGVQDLNILFSSVSFVVLLRGLVQAMEAGIADPDLVIWVQGLGVAAVLGRFAIVQQVMRQKVQKTILPIDVKPETAEVTGEAAASMSSLLTQLAFQISQSTRAIAEPLASHVASRATQEPSADLDASALPLTSIAHSQEEWPDLTLPNGMHLYSGSPYSDNDEDSVVGFLHSLTCEPPTATVDLEQSDARPHGSFTSQCMSGLSLTSVSMDEIGVTGNAAIPPAGQDTISGLLQTVGLSVDSTSTAQSDQSDGGSSSELEYELVGWEERVLTANGDQLQWSALCMTLLALSSSLLFVAHGLPNHITHASVEAATKDLPDLVSAVIDLSEQIVMAAALARARTSFNEVVHTEGNDVSHLLDGLCHKKGLGLFLETWGVVQCGVITGMITHIGLLQGVEWIEIPERETLKFMASFIR